VRRLHQNPRMETLLPRLKQRRKKTKKKRPSIGKMLAVFERKPIDSSRV